MEGHHLLHHHHHHQQQQHQRLQQHVNMSVNVVDVTADRFPQWSIQETKELLLIRAELDQSFMETKRNKQLWELVSNAMKERGYLRSSEQCKCKWKNLVTRYKGCETMEAEAMRQQFPFYSELQAIFTARTQRMPWAEGESVSKMKVTQFSSEDEEDANEDSEGDHKGSTSRRKKKRTKITRSVSGSGNSNISLKEILEEFMRQQMQIEAQWIEAFEARENERRLKEMEWRQAMEAIENERIMMEQRWREREEQRRIREETRAEKRDALITALLNKLTREEQEM